MLELETMAVPLDHAQVQLHRKRSGTIGSIDGFLTPPAEQETPEQVARAFVEANADPLGEHYPVYPDEAAGTSKSEGLAAAREDTALVALQPHLTAEGYYVKLQQTYQNVPLEESARIIHMTRDLRVHYVTNDLASDAPDLDVRAIMDKGLCRQDALHVVRSALPADRILAEPQVACVLVPYNGAWRLVWRVDLALAAAREIHSDADRSGDWRAYVGVETGQLELYERTLYARGRGRVFYPNPVVALHRSLTPSSTIPDRAYRDVTLMRLNRGDTLAGRYADTRDTMDRARHPGRDFRYDRTHRGFEEVMAYYFVDQVMAWLSRLGWRDLFQRRGPLLINAHGSRADESKYLPSRWGLSFGDGGVNDAEDASIILHELGHAIQDAQVDGWSSKAANTPVRAMGEGFGDWLSALYFAEERRGFNEGLVSDWDMCHRTPPYLRRVTEPKTMADWQGEEHADGEIWSAALWDLYQELGGKSGSQRARQRARSAAIQIVLQSHTYLADPMRETLTFADGASALLKADRMLSDNPATPGPNERIIRAVFAGRGIL